MAKDISVGVVIGASLAGNFKTVVGGVRQRFSEIGSEIKSLSMQRGLIDRFEKDQAALEKTRHELAATQQQIGKLKLALRKNPADEGTAKTLEQTTAKADKLARSLDRQKQKLGDSRSAMTRAGMAVENLGGQYVKLGNSIDKAAAKQAKMQSRMNAKDAAGSRLGELRGQAMGVAGVAYTALRTVGEAMDFESAMADVRKVVNFSQPDGLQKLGATLKEMSREIPITAEGLAQIAAAGGQLGIAENDLAGFTETVAKMATAFDMGAEEAGDVMAKLANIYQIPVTEMSTLGDAINHLSDNTAAKAKDIVPILARVGGTAKQFGLSAVQVAALGDAFVALGKPPEVAGTAINAMLTKMQTATRQGKSFQDGLAAMGMSAEDLEAAIAKDGQGALTSFLEQLSQIDAQQRTGILADLFGMEYADDISLLTGSLDQYQKALGLVADQADYAGSMQREFANRSSTTSNQLQLLKNGLSVVAINLGSALLPAINSLLKPAMALASWVGDMAERFPWMGRLMGAAAVGATVFVGGIMAMTAATWLWNAALLANPIGLVVAGVVAAAAMVITFWEPITGFFMGLWEGVKSIFSDGVAFLTSVWEMSPIGLLFKAGQALAGWVGGSASSGAMAPNLPAAAGAAGGSTTVTAPITINAAPGMDETKLAEQVGIELDKRASYGRARSRGKLYDD